VTSVKDLKIKSQDGIALATTVYEANSSLQEKNISVQINSATGTPRGYYDRFARFLAGSGFRVITYDYRGMFDSNQGNIRDDPACMRDWGEKDFAAVLGWLHESKPENKIISFGHSIGGTLMGLAPNNDLITSAINIATPSGYWRHWSGWKRYERLIDWYVLAPLIVNALGYVPAGFAGGAIPKGVALEWARWCRHAKFVVDQQGKPIHEGFKRFNRPFLFFSFSDDHFAPPAAVDAMRHLYSNAIIEHKIINPDDWGMRSIGHFTFFRKTAPQSVWLETTKWIEATAGRSHI
jgi:predicted alpha/beta hydrolase